MQEIEIRLGSVDMWMTAVEHLNHRAHKRAD